ncbi:hypothetical protein D3C71_1568570 [compost metagenome]
MWFLWIDNLKEDFTTIGVPLTEVFVAFFAIFKKVHDPLKFRLNFGLNRRTELSLLQIQQNWVIFHNNCLIANVGDTRCNFMVSGNFAVGINQVRQSFVLWIKIKAIGTPNVIQIASI